MITVVNLSDGTESFYTCSAIEAVRAAYAQSHPDEIIPEVTVGKASVACGDFCVLMIHLGDLRVGWDIGLRTGALFIWTTCKSCGETRWVITDKDKKPRAQLCKKCAIKQARNGGW
jgi:hypothetical protein